MLLLSLACTDANLAFKIQQVEAAPPVEDYQAALAHLEADRLAMAERGAGAEEARERVLSALRDDIWPAWYGTTWGFYGTTQTPREGEIACGYFVSTTLEDAGFHVERVKLAQQASKKIVQTFSDEDVTTWGRSNDAVLGRLEPGLNLVGLDYHVAFLDVREDDVYMCHSSVLEPVSVVCEPAATAEALDSNVHVTGPVLTDEVMRKWLAGEPIPTR
jgi:hypothetical protein